MALISVSCVHPLRFRRCSRGCAPRGVRVAKQQQLHSFSLCSCVSPPMALTSVILEQLRSRVRSCVSALRALTSVIRVHQLRFRLHSCVSAAMALTSVISLHSLRSRLCSSGSAARALTFVMRVPQATCSRGRSSGAEVGRGALFLF
jgi:hypothetical protein